MKTGRTMAVSMAALICLSSAVSAQNAGADSEQQQATGQQQQADDNANIWVDMTSWDASNLYQGWSANELLDEEVYGAAGEEIGEVEDFLMNDDGTIAAVVIEGGGFLDLGDSHIAVPWDEITRNGVASIKAPVGEDNLSSYGMFGGVDDDPRPQAGWRLKHLIGDYVTLNEGLGYGHVRDVIFSQDGKIDGIIATPAYGYGYPRGPIAFPYDPAYDPYASNYPVPYSTVELENVRPFDYGQLDQGHTGQTDTDGDQQTSG